MAEEHVKIPLRPAESAPSPTPKVMMDPEIAAQLDAAARDGRYVVFVARIDGYNTPDAKVRLFRKGKGFISGDLPALGSLLEDEIGRMMDEVKRGPDPS